MVKPSILRPINDWIAKNYSNSPGKMLIHTGVVGWIMSSAAQVFAIGINDNISNKQKAFLIPQEVADAAINILSFYAITQSCKSLASTLVKTGKLIPKKVFNELNAKNLLNRRGSLDFNVFKDVDLSEEAAKSLTKFANGVDFSAATLGAIVSCNIVTPIVRNHIAANRQQVALAKMGYVEDSNKIKNPYFPKPKMSDLFVVRGNAYSSSLKI